MLLIPGPGNRLLALLASDRVALLADHLEPVELRVRDNLEEPGKPVQFIHFPHDGMISIVASLPGDRDTEVGLVGNEGMTGLGFVLGDPIATFRAFVQVAGSGHRIRAERLRDALDLVPELNRLALLSARSFGIQVATTASANARLTIEHRLARWLLMCQDRLGATFNLTHEFIAIMLGVRRSGITVALQVLEGRGLIRSTRGRVQVLDRGGLIEMTDGAYGLAEAEDTRLFGASTLGLNDVFRLGRDANGADAGTSVDR